LIYSQKEIHVDLTLARTSAVENTFLFGQLAQYKVKIESAFGKPLAWLPLQQAAEALKKAYL